MVFFGISFIAVILFLFGLTLSEPMEYELENVCKKEGEYWYYISELCCPCSSCIYGDENFRHTRSACLQAEKKQYCDTEDRSLCQDVDFFFITKQSLTTSADLNQQSENIDLPLIISFTTCGLLIIFVIAFMCKLRSDSKQPKSFLYNLFWKKFSKQSAVQKELSTESESCEASQSINKSNEDINHNLEDRMAKTINGDSERIQQVADSYTDDTTEIQLGGGRDGVHLTKTPPPHSYPQPQPSTEPSRSPTNSSPSQPIANNSLPQFSTVHPSKSHSIYPLGPYPFANGQNINSELHPQPFLIPTNSSSNFIPPGPNPSQDFYPSYPSYKDTIVITNLTVTHGGTLNIGHGASNGLKLTEQTSNLAESRLPLGVTSESLNTKGSGNLNSSNQDEKTSVASRPVHPSRNDYNESVLRQKNLSFLTFKSNLAKFPSEAHWIPSDSKSGQLSHCSDSRVLYEQHSDVVDRPESFSVTHAKLSHPSEYADKSQNPICSGFSTESLNQYTFSCPVQETAISSPSDPLLDSNSHVSDNLDIYQTSSYFTSYTP